MTLWKNGIYAICPHLNTANFEDICKIPDEIFLAGYLEIMRRCDVVVLVYNWFESEGTKAEVSEAMRLGMHVVDPALFNLWLESTKKETGVIVKRGEIPKICWTA